MLRSRAGGAEISLRTRSRNDLFNRAGNGAGAKIRKNVEPEPQPKLNNLDSALCTGKGAPVLFSVKDP